MRRTAFSQLPVVTLHRGRDYAVFSHQSFTEDFIYPFMVEAYADYGDYKLAKVEVGVSRSLYGIQRGYSRTVVFDVHRRRIAVVR